MVHASYKWNATKAALWSASHLFRFLGHEDGVDLGEMGGDERFLNEFDGTRGEHRVPEWYE